MKDSQHQGSWRKIYRDSGTSRLNLLLQAKAIGDVQAAPTKFKIVGRSGPRVHDEHLLDTCPVHYLIDLLFSSTWSLFT